MGFDTEDEAKAHILETLEGMIAAGEVEVTEDHIRGRLYRLRKVLAFQA